MPKITVLIVDDHPIARAGIRTTLAEAKDIQVVGEAENGDEAMEMVAVLQPHILLLDLKMPGTPASEVEKWVRHHHPKTQTLVLTAHDRDAYLSQMIEAGVSGYMSKTARGDQLINAIRRAILGDYLISAEQLQRATHWREKSGGKLASLTPQDKEILSLLAIGATSKYMASSMAISIRTVELHLTEVYKKIGAGSRQEAISWWLQNNPKSMNQPED